MTVYIVTCTRPDCFDILGVYDNLKEANAIVAELKRLRANRSSSFKIFTRRLYESSL